MIFGLSTQVFYPHRLTTAQLDMLASSGVGVIELFAARHHVDYTDRAQVRELAAWFRGHDVRPTLHAPVSSEERFSRHSEPNLNLIAREKPRRIKAMEEIKRALELAETIPAATCVLHLGLASQLSPDEWSEYTIEYAMTAIEHLKAFAAPLGVRLLLENLPNKFATPAHLLEVLRIGHFSSCGICLDVGHAHLDELGFAQSLELVRPRVAELHLSDNDGRSDQHLWPASGTERPAFAQTGTLDWNACYAAIASLPGDIPNILQISDQQAGTGDAVARLAAEVISHASRLLEVSW